MYLRLLYGASGIFLQVPVRYRTIEHFSSNVEWNCWIWIGRGIAYNMFLENFLQQEKLLYSSFAAKQYGGIAVDGRNKHLQEVVPFNIRRPKIQKPKPADAIATSPASSVAVMVEFAFK